jgi:hypothetical protein
MLGSGVGVPIANGSRRHAISSWAATTPKIDEVFITSDRCILARPTGEVTHNLFIGSEADLIRNIHGIAEVARLDGDVIGYVLGKVAEARSIE